MQVEDILETGEMCSGERWAAREEERLRGQQEMGHRIITAELLSGAELITTFLHQL